jgi:uncharacterized alpha-E superfamily protein
VLFNKQFTRSIRYSLDKIGHYMDDIMETNTLPGKEGMIREFGRLKYRVQFADLEQVKETGSEQFIQEIRQQLIHFNKLLTQQFFSYA